MRTMTVMPVGYAAQKSFCGAQQTTKVLNRSLLKNTSSILKPLMGPKEKRKAQGWVAAYTLGNSAIAAGMAQMPGADEAVLAGVEVAMATHIFNGIYDFKFSKTALKSLAMGVAGHAVGKTTFKLLTKSVSWVPMFGNAVNAVVSGSTTAALGAAIIEMAEDIDKARKRGEKLDEFIKKLGG